MSLSWAWHSLLSPLSTCALSAACLFGKGKDLAINPTLVKSCEVSDKQYYQTDNSKEYYLLENENLQLVFSPSGSLLEINLSRQGKVRLPFSTLDRQVTAQTPEHSYFPLHSSKKGYLPLLRRATPTAHGLVAIPETEQGCALFTDAGELLTDWKLRSQSEQGIEFELIKDSYAIRKRFTFVENKSYSFTLVLEREGTAPNLWLSSGTLEAELVGSRSPCWILSTQGNKCRRQTLSEQKVSLTEVRCIAFANPFFTLSFANERPWPEVRIMPGDLPSRVACRQKSKIIGAKGFLPLKEGSIEIFAGPNQELEKGTLIALALKANWIPSKLHKWLSKLLSICKHFSQSWGLAIFLFSVVLRFFFLPLQALSWQMQKKIRVLEPRIIEIKEYWRDRPWEMQQQINALYRQQGINPLYALLPLFLQIPLLAAVFELLTTCLPLRGAPFLPGWIDDLSAPDSFAGIHLLPGAFAVAVLCQQMATTSTNRQMAFSMLPLIVWASYRLPAALQIYWISSTLFTTCYQLLLQKLERRERGLIA